MTEFLIDTNVLSETARLVPEPRVMAWLRATPLRLLAISVITLGELQLGVESLPTGKRKLQLATWLAHEAPRRFGRKRLPVTETIAERWAQLVMQARQNGTVLKTNDGLIAATAAEHRLTLVTRNTRDFTGLGVALLNPWD